MINHLYEIDKITDTEGNDRLDGRYPLRIGRRFEFFRPIVRGVPMILEYNPRDGEDYCGTLRTSTVQDIQIDNDDHSYKITTINTIYYFKRSI